jgi:Uma2 family endonuclease
MVHHHSFEDYLAIEQTSTVRHEFLNGGIYAMASGSARHAALAGAVLTELGKQLAGRCRTFTSDLRVRITATGLATYPDVTVVSGPLETDGGHRDTAINPAAVVEVLSPATMDYDLGEKFEHYRQLPSLKAVVYLWQDRRQLEVRQRTDGGAWQTRTAGAGGSLPLEALGCVLGIDAIYTRAGA